MRLTTIYMFFPMLYLSWSLATTPESKPEEMSPYAHNFSSLKLLEEEQERLG